MPSASLFDHADGVRHDFVNMVRTNTFVAVAFSSNFCCARGRGGVGSARSPGSAFPKEAASMGTPLGHHDSQEFTSNAATRGKQAVVVVPLIPGLLIAAVTVSAHWLK